MADKRISALTAAATLDKTETFPIVQGGVTVKATIAQALAPLTILQSDAGTMLAGVPAYPVDGQVYLLTSLGITGVDHIRTVGIVDANTADFVFNNNCEAYLDGLGVYVPCTYDVATNVLSLNSITKKVSVTASQIRNGNTTPIVLVSGVTGMYIQLESLSAKFTYTAPTFDGAFDLYVYYSSSPSTPIFQSLGFWASIENDFVTTICNVNYTSVQALTFNENDDIIIKVDGDSLGGDSSVEFYMTYKIVLP